MSHILQLLLLLSAIVIIAKLAGAISLRLGQPAVFGEILVGLILGPTVLDILGYPLFSNVEVASEGSLGSLLSAAAVQGEAGHRLVLSVILKDLADIGVILLMFVAGLETELEKIKGVGAAAFWAAVGGVILPLGFGALFSYYSGLGGMESIFIGTILTATSVSISAQTLMELGALRTREGSAILGAAVIDDVLGIFLLSVVVALSSKGRLDGAGLGSLFWIMARMAGFFVVFWFIGRRFLEPAAARFSQLPASQALLAFVLVAAFLYSWGAEYIGGVAAITGSYMAGLLLGQTCFKKQIDSGIHPVTYSLFVPVFFISIGLEADARPLVKEPAFVIWIIAIAITAKALGCFLGATLAGFAPLEALRVGVGMISRGEVGLIVASYGLAHNIIDRRIFSAMVVMVLATTVVTPLLLTRVFPKRKLRRAEVFESVGGIEEESREEGDAADRTGS